jgi:hypothetical protein
MLAGRHRRLILLDERGGLLLRYGLQHGRGGRGGLRLAAPPRLGRPLRSTQAKGLQVLGQFAIIAADNLIHIGPNPTLTP